MNLIEATTFGDMPIGAKFITESIPYDVMPESERKGLAPWIKYDEYRMLSPQYSVPFDLHYVTMDFKHSDLFDFLNGTYSSDLSQGFTATPKCERRTTFGEDTVTPNGELRQLDDTTEPYTLHNDSYFYQGYGRMPLRASFNSDERSLFRMAFRIPNGIELDDIINGGALKEAQLKKLQFWAGAVTGNTAYPLGRAKLVSIRDGHLRSKYVNSHERHRTNCTACIDPSWGIYALHLADAADVFMTQETASYLLSRANRTIENFQQTKPFGLMNLLCLLRGLRGLCKEEKMPYLIFKDGTFTDGRPLKSIIVEDIIRSFMQEI